MPELAEVEFGRRVAEARTRGRRIAEAVADDDPIVFDEASPKEVRDALVGATVGSVERHGKQLWFALADERPAVLVHFGMTGGFRTPDDAPIQLENSPAEVDRSWPPRFCKLRLVLDDGGELAFTNARRLGRVRLRKDPRAQPPVSRLGYDPLLELPTAAEFAARVGRRRVTLKGLLLDQKCAAGVGNWIADEVLYQARLDPRRRANELSPDELDRVRRTLRAVVEQAVAVDARKDHFPADWLFHRRWGKGEGRTTLEGEPIEFLTVAGRTTAWVPARQG